MAWSVKVAVFVGAVVGVPGAIAACSGGGQWVDAGSSGAGHGGQGGAGGTLFPGTGGGDACTGLECQQVPCPNGATTTVSGTVFDPAGTLPLYNVMVYVPNAPLDDFIDGASCQQCMAALSGDPVVTTLTDTHGRFVLKNVPVGDDIPLVIQIGKWRRQLTLPKVAECVDNPTVDGEVRLPRNKSEGNIPKIALTTGGADPLECLLVKLGLDLDEFTNPSGNGRVNLFAGPGGSDQYASGPDLETAENFWATLDSLMGYDMVLLACEGGPNVAYKPMSARQALLDYTSAGGRVFASHWHHVWIQQGPAPWPAIATWDIQPDPTDHPFIGTIDTSFPKGQALSDWLVDVGASTTPGELVIVEAQHSLEAVDPAMATRWIYSAAPITPGVQYFTFNTPVQAPDDQKCGRVVYSDIHVSSGDQIGAPFPDGCVTTALSPQEKALLFMLFDLSACVIPDDEPPVPPE